VKKPAKPKARKAVAKPAAPRKEPEKHFAQAARRGTPKPQGKKPSASVAANTTTPKQTIPKPSAGQN
jgi:hypothetical protein